MGLDVGVFGDELRRGPDVLDDIIHDEDAAILVDFSL